MKPSLPSSNLGVVFYFKPNGTALLHNISPSTVNIAHSEQVEEIQVIEVALRTSEPDKRIFATIRKAIPYKIVFALFYENKTTYMVYYDSNTCFTSDVPPKLVGNNTDSVWESIIIQIGGIEISENRTLEEQITFNVEQETLLRKIESLEKQAQNEKQPRRKWELTEELRQLKEKMGIV